MPSVLTPRVWSQSRTPPATTHKTTSLTVPPRTSLMPLNWARSERTQTKRRWDPIGTLSGSVGAGFAKFQATSPTRPRARPRGTNRAGATRRAGPAGRARAGSWRGRRLPWRRAAPRTAGERHPVVLGTHRLGHRLQVEEDRCDVDARDAVDQRVMGLRDDREALAGQALDKPEFPERLRAIELLARTRVRRGFGNCSSEPGDGSAE